MMDILYVACYPDSYFDTLQKSAIASTSLPSQKFNKLIMDGLKANDASVTVLNTYNQTAHNQRIAQPEFSTTEENGIKYHLIPYHPVGLANRLMAKASIKQFLRSWREAHPDSVIVVDCLKPFAEFIYRFSKGLPVISIVTDLPEHLGHGHWLRRRLAVFVKSKLFDDMMKRSSAFIFLTEPMNQKLNKRRLPYIIMEGLVDHSHTLAPSHKTSDTFTCVYTGALAARYGLDALVQSFFLPDMQEFHLNLYGNGDYVPAIEAASQAHPNIHYGGILDRRAVLDVQESASLLINPRPVNADFTKYSFPSKNMEYMLSGTPVLTTNLPGMPSEYHEHVFILDSSTPDAIARRIKEIAALEPRFLYNKGQGARAFVLSKKNNIVQGERIIRMAERPL